MTNDSNNKEVIERIKSLEETDKKFYDRFNAMTENIAKLSVSTELMQEAVTKLAEVKEQMQSIHTSLIDRINEQNIRITKLETGYSGAKFIVSAIITTLCGILVGKFF